MSRQSFSLTLRGETAALYAEAAELTGETRHNGEALREIVQFYIDNHGTAELSDEAAEKQAEIKQDILDRL